MCASWAQARALWDSPLRRLGVQMKCVSVWKHKSYRATVTLTDLPEAIPLLKANAVANSAATGDRVTVTPYRWGDTSPHMPPIDLLLVIDCVYYKEVV